uniref:HRAS-like suppressor 3 n=1 Tax=Sinocyclocheilus rhinocerous TaxID=307959 RepID=A0A673H4Y4_9TELE
MAKYEKKPEPGDLIEIFRGTYQHWAIYVGEGYVIHLAPPCEYFTCLKLCLLSLTCIQSETFHLSLMIAFTFSFSFSSAEHAQAGAYSMMSVLCDKATVKKEELYEVVGNDEYCINNLLDEKYKPRPVREILRDAHRFLGKELPYSVFTSNCEHFVTELRYGEPQSRQVRDAVETVAAVAVAGIGIGAVVYAISKMFGSKDKEKQTQ